MALDDKTVLKTVIKHLTILLEHTSVHAEIKFARGNYLKCAHN